jgi:DNA-binding transcriptional LysR family regulator
MNPTKGFHPGMNVAHDTADVGSPEQLARLDLNLLVAFDALARERNVTRAAQRTGVTQSAMSHALSRLRDLFGDPLLVRGRGGMMLTPRAEALVVPLRSGLSTLGRALAQPASFDAKSARRAFRVASPDLFDVLVVPRLLQRIRSEAPGIDVVVVPLAERGLAERLESGELDVAVAPRVDPVRDAVAGGAPAGLLQSRLFRDRFVCFLRADHPALGTSARRKQAAPRLSLRTFSELSHALISPSGEGPGFVDELLAERGLRRRVALRIPHFYAALAIVAKSDLVLTAPQALRQLVPESARVAVLECPLPLPKHSVNLVWHERYAKDPGHTWLRELLSDESRGLQRDIGRP